MGRTIDESIRGAVILSKPAFSTNEKGALKKRPTEVGAGGTGGGKPPRERDDEDDDFERCMKQMNKRYALVLQGSRAKIICEDPDAPAGERVRYLIPEAFAAYLQNRPVRITTSSTDARTGAVTMRFKSVNPAKAWLEWSGRRTFDGVIFHPDPNDAPAPVGRFNLWRGFAEDAKALLPATPDPDRWRAYGVLRDHLKTNICSGDEAHFRWLFYWFAHMVQRPRERLGTAIVLQGRQGTGKTKIGEVFGSLFPDHYILGDDERLLTGQFNAHLEHCLLLQADEGFWAGDKSKEGRLKGLVTSHFQIIEHKGVDPIVCPNYVHLLITSNEDWVIPAGIEERRFAVFTVASYAAQNHGYFAEMDAQMNAGGRAALLADLLSLDLDAPGAPNLRAIPKTQALLRQKLESLEPCTRWIFNCLWQGTIADYDSGWPTIIPRASVHSAYLRDLERQGTRRKLDASRFGSKLVELLPGLGATRVRDPASASDMRVWCYVVPSLADARAAFEERLCQQFAWPAIDEGSAGDEGAHHE